MEGVKELDVVITAAGEDTALDSFYQWLRDDRDVARAAQVTMRATPNTGRMGTFDIMTVVLSNAVAFPTLVMGYVSWRKARGRTAELTITIGAVSTTVKDASPETVRLLLGLAEGNG
jgi:hypothetical protein